MFTERDLYVAGTFWGSGAINCVSQAIIYANSANTMFVIFSISSISITKPNQRQSSFGSIYYSLIKLE